MALLSDFFLATKAELESFDISMGPAGSLPAVQARSVEVVKLVQLQCIMDGSVLSDHLDHLGSMLVRSESDEGPWVFLVPDVVTRTLAESDDSKLRQFAKAWAATDEWKLDGGRPDEITALLTDVGSLAKRASVENREMYLWVSS